MAVELRITRGARSGARERFEKSIIAIGRHPINDLRFDAERDLDVSSRHAELRVVGDRCVIVDLDSTNGTFVNGTRIAGEHALSDGDVLTFGANGPQLEFRRERDAAAAAGAAAAAPPPRTQKSTPAQGGAVAPVGARSSAGAGASAERPATEVRIAMAVEKHTSGLKRLVLGLAAVMIVGALAAVWMTRKSSSEARAQMATLLAANDSLSRSLQSRLAEVGIADASLAAARAETERLARELRAQQQRGGDVSSYAARMRESQERTATIAGMDYAGVAEANQAAIVFLVVEFPDSARSTGTGFNVLPSGLIVTNRHVIETPDGTRAQRIAVAFDGTQAQWKRGSVEVVSTTDELAFLRITSPGTYPTVAAISERDDAGIGAPVGILGYPLGTSTVGMGGDINTLRPSASLSVGTVSKLVDGTLQLDAFAAQGSSGSPVFNARGAVVGVVYGGATESGGRIVYAVPASRLAAQLPADARGLIR